MTVRRNGKGHSPQVDLTKGSVPVLIVASLLVFIAYAAYSIGGLISTLQSDKVTADAKFASIERDLQVIRTLLERTEHISPSDFKSWCEVTEAINKGWKCGDTSSLGRNRQ